MFHLTTRAGALVLMRDGEPFTYSSRHLAGMGARYLSGHERGQLSIVEA